MCRLHSVAEKPGVTITNRYKYKCLQKIGGLKSEVCEI